jgi:hypothetical protein
VESRQFGDVFGFLGVRGIMKNKYRIRHVYKKD